MFREKGGKESCGSLLRGGLLGWLRPFSSFFTCRRPGKVNSQQDMESLQIDRAS